MLVTRVHARAFGALIDQTLDLAGGLTVVFGPNESGKSTWHAALLAALYGGASRRDPELERYRPWQGSSWQVGAELQLSDGRQMMLWQDLDGRSGTVRDLVLGSDQAQEFAGAAKGRWPDVSRRLGLDRKAFLATACVRQSDVQRVTEQAQGIQTYVQQAASTAGADTTAAAAIDRLDAFVKQRLGGPRRPRLRDAERGLAEAEEALRVSREKQAELDERSAQARRLRAEADVALVRLRLQEAGRAQAEAQRLRDRSTRAHELVQSIAAVDGAEVTDGVLLTDVAVVTGGASATGGASVTGGRAAAGAAGVSPAGESGVAEDARAALARWRSLPPEPAPPPVSAPSDSTPLSASGTAGAGETADTQAPAGSSGPRPFSRPRGKARGWPALVFAIVVAALAIVGSATLLASHAILAGGMVLAVGLLGAAGLVYFGRSAPDHDTIGDADLPAGHVPGAIAADAVASQTAAVQLLDQHWAQERDRAARAVLAAASRAGVGDGEVATTVPVLEQWLAGERQRAEAAARRLQLAALLDGRTVDDLVASVEAVSQEARAAADRVQQAQARAAESIRWVAGGPSTVDGWLERSTQPTDIDEVSAAEGRARAAEQAVRDEAGRLVAVADAEETRDAVRAQTDRLRELDDVLTLTRRHLVQAQEQVYQAIAPDLVAAVRRDLAAVTLGRYTDVAVHPGSLAVQVRSGNGPLREANLLSVGAAEQVYLLLRVALAAWRVTEGESCPLVLDDVTVHADEQRKEQLLRVLLTVAQERQVVLFTQEEHVRRWAGTHLDGDRHVLRELTTLSDG